MRRDEFLTTEPGFLAELAAECLEGYLALAPGAAVDSFPRAIPVNFALEGGRIYFHGALGGDKFERIGPGVAAGFTIARPCSLLPSTWMSEGDSACPATQLFLSVEAYGVCEPVKETAEKAHGLQVLMQKYQPEGGYRPLNAADSGYTGSMSGTGVFRLEIERWTGKIRLAQEKSPGFRRRLIERLRERALPIDRETADRIEKTLPDGNSEDRPLRSNGS